MRRSRLRRVTGASSFRIKIMSTASRLLFPPTHIYGGTERARTHATITSDHIPVAWQRGTAAAQSEVLSSHGARGSRASRGRSCAASRNGLTPTSCAMCSALCGQLMVCGHCAVPLMLPRTSNGFPNMEKLHERSRRPYRRRGDRHPAP